MNRIQFAKIILDDFLEFIEETNDIGLDDIYSKKLFIAEFVKLQKIYNPFIKPAILISRKRHPAITSRTSPEERNRLLKTSKAGGIPYFHQNEKWPACNSCKQPMKLIYQLNLDQISNDLGDKFGTGIIQWFQCENSAAETSDNFDFSKPDCIDYDKYIYRSSEFSQTFIDNNEKTDSHEFYTKNRFITLRHIRIRDSAYWNDKLYDKYKFHDFHHNHLDSFLIENFHYGHNEIMSASDICDADPDSSRGYFSDLFMRHYGDVIDDEVDLSELYSSFVGYTYDNVKKSSIAKRYKEYNLLPAHPLTGFSLCAQVEWQCGSDHINYPRCEKCSNEMQYLVYISDGIFWYRLFRCKRHSKELAIIMDNYS